MRYASVCDGIGAVHVAWKPLGWECAWTSEIEPFPAAVVEHHFGYPNLGDMTKITQEQLNERGPIELLVGGTPCQSFSVAGLRGGLDDPRGNLALRFLQLAAVARPRWLCWENVPGVLSSGGGRDFGSILGGMAELGYGFAFRILDAQYFGVPQRRRRVFVVGCLGGWQRAAAVLFERHSLSGHPAPSREAGARVANAITRGIAGGAGGADDNDGQGNHLVPEISLCLNAGGMGRIDLETETMIPVVSHALKGEGHDASEDGTGRGVPIIPFDTTQITSSSNYSNPKVGDPCHPLAAGAHSPAIAFQSKYFSGRPEQGGKPAAIAPTLTSAQAERSDGEIKVAYQCHGSNVGPMGTMRKGNGNHTGGVPFIVEEQNAHVQVREVRQENQGESGSGEDQQGDGLDNPLLELHPVAFQTRIARNGRGQPKEIADALTSCDGGTHADSKPHVAGAFGVRRLTPEECEALQGFRRKYTAIMFRGKQAADAPRYKALGNSMAVPVMAWIGQRIAMVEQL